MGFKIPFSFKSSESVFSDNDLDAEAYFTLVESRPTDSLTLRLLAYHNYKRQSKLLLEHLDRQSNRNKVPKKVILENKLFNEEQIKTYFKSAEKDFLIDIRAYESKNNNKKKEESNVKRASYYNVIFSKEFLTSANFKMILVIILVVLLIGLVLISGNEIVLKILDLIKDKKL